ncbi:MAG: hypothetical protein ABL952_11925 [Pyrinomonadaceae bacterium]
MNRHRFLTFFGFSTILLMLIFSANIAAQQDDGPPAHNFAGTWSLRQSNGYVVTMVLTQNGRDIAGTSSYNSGKKGIVRCTVSGKAWHQKGANGWPSYLDHFQVEVVCNGSVAAYNASASWAEGILNGTTYPKGKPSASATWSAGPFARRRN